MGAAQSAQRWEPPAEATGGGELPDGSHPAISHHLASRTWLPEGGVLPGLSG